MIEMYKVNGIVYFLSFHSKILYLLFITRKVIELVFLADSLKNTRISVFLFFLSNVSGVQAKRLSIQVFRLVTSEFFSVSEIHRRSAYE